MAATDSFAAVTAPVATQVKAIQITLTLVDAIPAAGENPAVPKAYSGRYSFDRLAVDGTIVDVREGNLVPHLTTTQVTQIKAFMDAMLTKAQGSI